MGVVAYLALVIAIPALACGHQGQDWPPVAVWRGVTAALALAGLRNGSTGPSWARGWLRTRIYVLCHARSSGGLLRLRALRMLGAPLVHRRLGPDGSAPDLLRLGEVGGSVDEVVDALPVDAETCRDSAAEVLGQDPLRHALAIARTINTGGQP